MTIIPTLTVAGWGLVSAWRLLRVSLNGARRPSASALSCGAFLLAAIVDTDAHGGPQQLTTWGLLLSHLPWIAALALTGRCLGRGYYGGGCPPWVRPLWAGIAVTVLALGVTAVPAGDTPTIAEHQNPWLTAHQLLFHASTLVLAGGVVLIALAGTRVVRQRHRASLFLFALAGWSTFESALINIQATARLEPASPSAAALAQASLVVYLIAFGLPLLPRRARHLPSASAELESLWRILSPDQPPLAVDDQSDTGPWVSDAVIAIRDRIAELQQWCPRDTLRAGEQAARSNGLRGKQAHAAAAAECLWVALRREADERPHADPHSNLMGSGGRWLDQEIWWLLEVHRTLARIAGCAPRTAQRAAPTPSPLSDPDVVARCEQRLNDWLPRPLPASLGAIRATIARRRARPIGVTVGTQLPGRALYAETADLDLLFLDERDSEFMRIVNEAHELGHLICGHPTVPLGPTNPVSAEELQQALPDLDPALVLGLHGRCLGGVADWHDDPTEAEAEITGRLIVRHLLHAPGAGIAAYLDER